MFGSDDDKPKFKGFLEHTVNDDEPINTVESKISISHPNVKVEGRQVISYDRKTFS